VGIDHRWCDRIRRSGDGPEEHAMGLLADIHDYYVTRHIDFTNWFEWTPDLPEQVCGPRPHWRAVDADRRLGADVL
jgi:hypothetical protein